MGRLARLRHLPHFMVGRVRPFHERASQNDSRLFDSGLRTREHYNVRTRQHPWQSVAEALLDREKDAVDPAGLAPLIEALHAGRMSPYAHGFSDVEVLAQEAPKPRITGPPICHLKPHVPFGPRQSGLC